MKLKNQSNNFSDRFFSKFSLYFICFIFIFSFPVFLKNFNNNSEEKTASAASGYWTNSRASSFAGGSGSENYPFIIKTAEQLAKLAYDVNNNINDYYGRFFRLESDLDLSSRLWVPIGYKLNNIGASFKGHFDGNFQIIHGLTIDGFYHNDGKIYHYDSAVGLFGVAGGGGSIKNVIVENAELKLGKENLSGDGSDRQNNDIGTIVGLTTGSITIENCIVRNAKINSYSKISVFYRGTAVGGIVGYISEANKVEIKNCMAIGLEMLFVDGGLSGAVIRFLVGGIVGRSDSSGNLNNFNPYITVGNCYSIIELFSSYFSGSTSKSSYLFNGIGPDLYSNRCITTNCLTNKEREYRGTTGYEGGDITVNTALSSTNISTFSNWNTNKIIAIYGDSLFTTNVASSSCGWGWLASRGEVMPLAYYKAKFWAFNPASSFG